MINNKKCSYIKICSCHRWHQKLKKKHKAHYDDIYIFLHVKFGLALFLFKSKSARDHCRHLVGSRMIKSMFFVHNFIFIKKYELIVLITMNTNTWDASGLSTHQHTNFICLRTFFCFDDLFPVFLLLYLVLPHSRL